MQGHFNAFLWRTLYDLWNCLHTIFKGLTGHTGKIQKITKRTNINLVAESNAIAMPQMPSTDQILGQSLQELSHDEKVRIATEFAQEQFVDKGLGVDIAFHDFDSKNPLPVTGNGQKCLKFDQICPKISTFGQNEA